MVVNPSHQPVSRLRSGSRYGVALFPDRRALVAHVLEREEAVRSSADETVEVGDLTICRNERTATWRSDPLRLTPREFDILTLLAVHAGEALSRGDIFDLAWDTDFAGEARLVDSHIMRLRRKLGDGAALIESVRGTGFRLALSREHD